MSPIKMKNKKTFKKILIFSTLVLGLGIFLIVYTNLNDPAKIITKAIEANEINDDFIGKQTAVYLVTDVNNSCRPCSKYDFLKKQKNIHITFYVPSDYSDNDIDNFRDAFDIPAKYFVARITAQWRKIFDKCNTGEERQYNLLVLVDDKAKVAGVWRF